MVANFLQSIAPVVTAALPSITSTAFSKGGGTDKASAADLMMLQSNLWKDNTKWYNDNILAHAYKNTRSSLEEAGYNPLMAVSNGALYDQGAMPNASANSSAKSFSMNQLAKSQIANVNADTILKGAQTEQNISSANLLNQQKETEVYSTRLEQLHTEMQEIENKIRNKDYDSYDIRLYNELRQTEIKMIEAITNRYNSQSNKIIASAKDYEAKNKGFTTSVHGPLGIGITHTGGPNQYTKIRSGKYVKKYENINGKKVPVSTYKGY